MVDRDFTLPRERLAEFCTRHHIARLSLFGSILTDDFGPESDIDVLVEFLPGQGPSLLGFAGMQVELASMLNREVHLHTPAMLDPRWRDQVTHEARVQYAA